MINTTVRFFTYCYNEYDVVDICEISESTFNSLIGTITYERHTIHDNGVNQICLTIEPKDYPPQSDVEIE